MIDLFLQESFAEWLVPLTILIMWILSFRIMSLAYSANINNRYQSIKREESYFINPAFDEPGPSFCLQLITIVRRKVCPDDTDEYVLSFYFK